MGWQQTVGLGMQLVGSGIAGVGIWQTWREHAQEKFWGPPVRSFKDSTQWIKNRALWVWTKLGGPRSTGAQIHVPAASASSSGSSATVRLGWGPPPEIVTDPAGFADVVADRVNQLHQTVQDLNDKIYAEQKARDSAIDGLRSELAARDSHVEELAHGVAVDGLRWEALGIGLVVVGTALGAWG